MQNVSQGSKASILILCLAAAMLIIASAFTITSCGPYHGGVFVGAPMEGGPVYVREGPPPPRVIARPPHPGGVAIWIDGRWEWDGNRYNWRDGYWDRHPKGKAWAPGTWKKHPKGWKYHEGHWH